MVSQEKCYSRDDSRMIANSIAILILMILIQQEKVENTEWEVHVA